MPKKPECERAIRYLTTEWALQQPDRLEPDWHPSFLAFRRWLSAQGHGHLLRFRSVAGPLEDAERWFDQELRQTWRN